jgi:glycerol-3-phosphate cytidylyltransferase
MIDHKKIIGFTCSSFDLLHAGHIIMLEDAKKKCDYLIVGLQNDPSIDRPEKNKPSQSIVERFIQLDAVKYVDKIIVYNTELDLCDILSAIHIDIRILGEEYENTEFTGKKICINNGILIFYNKRRHRYSSSGLRKQINHLDKKV